MNRSPFSLFYGGTKVVISETHSFTLQSLFYYLAFYQYTCATSTVKLKKQECVKSCVVTSDVGGTYSPFSRHLFPSFSNVSFQGLNKAKSRLDSSQEGWNL